jgi:hypothetical protein
MGVAGLDRNRSGPPSGAAAAIEWKRSYVSWLTADPREKGQ